MKGARILATCLTLALAALLFAVPAGAADAAKPGLSADDCAKCHAAQPADIDAAGGKHKTDINCIDCHAAHRPASKNNIPKCSNCHEGKDHYKLANCLACHKNPHKPTAVTYGPNVTDPCLSCHQDQIKQLKQFKSKHTALFCSTCHTVHRKIPACTDCHKPHGKEMTKGDCKKCHKAHQPTTLTYGPDVPNKDCGACHGKAEQALAASGFKHKSVACVKCHKEKHRTVPACAECHPNKHNAKILKKFPKCGTCHSVAHDLYGFGDGAPAKAAPAKAKKP